MQTLHEPWINVKHSDHRVTQNHSSTITYYNIHNHTINFVPRTSSTRTTCTTQTNLEDSSDPTTAMNKALALLAKAFKVNTIPTNNNQRSSLIPRNSQTTQQDMHTSQDIKMQMVDDNDRKSVRQNVDCNMMQLEIANQYGNGNVVTAPDEGNGNGIDGNPIRCYNCREEEGSLSKQLHSKAKETGCCLLSTHCRMLNEEEAGIQSTQEEFEFMTAADAL
ncbi:hypothetical protein Tco_1402720 [Tanacetum coccineum]